jgi:exopolysaccharide production protein ExoZ
VSCLAPIPPVPARVTVSAPRLAGREKNLLIEALRGFAALNVLLFHSVGAHAAGVLHPALDLVLHLVRANPFRVNVFFVLGGWCLVGLAAHFRRQGESASVFLRQRFLRVFPLYWIVLALAVLLRLAAIPFNHASPAAIIPDGWTGVLADLVLAQPYLGTQPALLVSWTLVVEIGFYFSIALALVLVRRGVAARHLLAAGAALCLVAAAFELPRALIVLKLWPLFMVGVVCWWLAHRAAERVYAGGCALLVGACILWRSGFAAWPTHAATFGTGFLLLAHHRGLVTLRDSLPLRVLVWLGAISYSLYLIHVPVLSPFLNLSARLVPITSPAYVAAWALGVALALCAAWLLHRHLDRPLERWRKQNRDPLPAPASG